MSGIYKIYNQTDGRSYIGNAINIKRRIKEHFNRLNKGTHHNQFLQRAFDKYGEQSFYAEVLEYCDRYKLIEREQYWLDTIENKYNILNEAESRLGFIHSFQTKQKIGKAHKGKQLSDKTKQKISKANKGRKLSEEHKQRISERMSGKKHPLYNKRHSEKSCKKMSEIRLANNIIGEKHGRSKLNEKQVRIIKRSNCSLSFLAKIFGVSSATIDKIKNNINWSHIKL